SPLEDVLGEILWERGLDYRWESGKVLITARDVAERHLAKRTYYLAKLCEKDEDFSDLLGYIEKSGGQWEWGAYGGFATVEADVEKRRVTITHTDSNHMRIVQAIESWRAAALSPEDDDEE